MWIEQDPLLYGESAERLMVEMQQFQARYRWPVQTLISRELSEAAARRYVLRASQPPENPVDAFALLLQHRAQCRKTRLFKVIRRMNTRWARINRLRESPPPYLPKFLTWWIAVLEKQRIADCMNTQRAVRRHPDRKKARDSARYRRDRDRLLLKSRLYYEANKDKRREYSLRYRLAHLRPKAPPRPRKTPEELEASRKASKRKSRVKDRLLRRLSERVRMALKRRRVYKSARTMELIGCTVPELWAHLEQRFQPGMTRENYGQWHVDHIRPCASFDLRDLAQQRQCFHFSNLQPLWAADNLRKQAKWVPGNPRYLD